MKKKICYLVIIVLVLFLLFFLYKKICFNMYYKNNHKIIISNETVTVNEKDYKNYLKYNGIKIENIFKNYIYEDESYILLDKDEEIIETFFEFEGITYIEAFLYGMDNIQSLDEELLNEKQREKIIKDNNIKRDIDLIRYMYDYLNKELTVFSSMKELRTYAYINKFISNTIPLVEDYKEIVGDYEGIIIYVGNMDFENDILINLYHNNKRYRLYFVGNELTEENILELLRTVRFDEEE